MLKSLSNCCFFLAESVILYFLVSWWFRTVYQRDTHPLKWPNGRVGKQRGSNYSPVHSPGWSVKLKGEYPGYIDFNIFEITKKFEKKIDSQETISGC